MHLWPFTIEPDAHGKAAFVLQLTEGYKNIDPIEISARVLAEVKKWAETKVGREVKNAVVTVPAYFINSQLEATMKACEIAGLDCKKLLKEPTAAAIAFGVDKGSENLKRCLVYDFGGGTLDITILKLENRMIEVMSVSGDSNLGGVDIDNILVDYCIEEFKRGNADDC